MRAFHEAYLFGPDMTEAASFQKIKDRLTAFPRYNGYEPDTALGTRMAFVGQTSVFISISDLAVGLTFFMRQDMIDRFLQVCGGDQSNTAQLSEILSAAGNGIDRLKVNTSFNSQEGLRISAKAERLGIEDISSTPVSPAVFQIMVSLIRLNREVDMGLMIEQPEDSGKRYPEELGKSAGRRRGKGYTIRKSRAAHK